MKPHKTKNYDITKEKKVLSERVFMSRILTRDILCKIDVV
jgi:hypothetical protein